MRNVKAGDLVIPAQSGLGNNSLFDRFSLPFELGTWCSHGLYDSSQLFPIDGELGPVEAATLQVNPSTAYRMLHDFVAPKPTSFVVAQNGANSAVGRYVIQVGSFSEEILNEEF